VFRGFQYRTVSRRRQSWLAKATLWPRTAAPITLGLALQVPGLRPFSRRRLISGDDRRTLYILTTRSALGSGKLGSGKLGFGEALGSVKLKIAGMTVPANCG